jgi:hypothetical protein
MEDKETVEKGRQMKAGENAMCSLSPKAVGEADRSVPVNENGQNEATYLHPYRVG